LKGEVPWLFCVPSGEVSAGLAREVAKAVIAALGSPFKPERVFLVEALPKTRSAKIVRRAVRAGALGTDPGDLSSLENPESIDALARAVRG
jgi:acetyl-CoA synthetase